MRMGPVMSGASTDADAPFDSAFHAALNERQHVSNCKGLRLRLGTALVFQIPFGQTPITDHDAMRDADQFHVCELDARAGFLVAVIEQHFKTGGFQLGVQFVCRLRTASVS